jgi:hypothetical protein
MTMLSPGNTALESALHRALDAIVKLDKAGVTVSDIVIRGLTPVLRVDRSPSFVSGSVRMARSFGMTRMIVHAAPYFGTQLEWVEHTLRKVHA